MRTWAGAPLRVLVAHNRYSSETPSGENLVVDEQVDGLRAAGVDVSTFFADNDTTKRASMATKARALPAAVWSASVRRRFATELDRFDPHVVHVHNTLPLLSPSVFAAALDNGAATVWTAHNYRLSCVASTHHRDGRACHDCDGTARLAGVAHGCYAGSRAASGAATLAALSQGRLVRRLGAVVAISEHMRGWLVEQRRINPAVVRTIPNGVPAHMSTAKPSSSDVLVFASRLSAEKGVTLLLEAWRQRSSRSGRLLIVGDGQLGAAVRAAAAHDSSIHAVGAEAAGASRARIAAARGVIVLPSWDEPFGRTAAEALGAGRPVIATQRGGLREIVDGTVGIPVAEEPGAVAAAMDALLTQGSLADELGARGEERWSMRYRPEVAIARLGALYVDLARGSSAG